MAKRFTLFLILTVGLLLLVLAYAGPHWTVEAKTKVAEPKIGLIDLNRIKKEAPPFIALGQRAKNNQRILEEFTAQVLAEHQQQIKALSLDDFERSRELAATTQARLDQKRQELEESYRRQEEAVLKELEAVVAHVAKKKKYDCILLKSGFQVGGDDVTDQVLKTWDKWGLTFCQRVWIFFGGKDPRSDSLAEGSGGGE
ncbi:MAG: OmpH family outer membrane protein [Firmicutes bacterium]|nr:OmpH family outer membrane protein [Bacillota bacterium]